MTTPKAKISIETKTIIGEVVRLGETYPSPITHENEDGTSVEVIYFDVRANSRRYKVQVRGDRTISAFRDAEFENKMDGNWYKFSPPEIGDFVSLTGSFRVAPATKKFDRPQNVITIWEPWNVRGVKATKRPAKKSMASW